MGSGLLEPVHPVELGDRRRPEKARERKDQIFGITAASTMKPLGDVKTTPA